MIKRKRCIASGRSKEDFVGKRKEILPATAFFFGQPEAPFVYSIGNKGYNIREASISK